MFPVWCLAASPVFDRTWLVGDPPQGSGGVALRRPRRRRRASPPRPPPSGTPTLQQHAGVLRVEVGGQNGEPKLGRQDQPKHQPSLTPEEPPDAKQPGEGP